MALPKKKPDAAQWPFPTGRRNVAVSPATKKKASPARALSTKKYEVMASLKNVELVKAGSALTLEITDGGTVLGKLEIGSGSFFWYGANKKKGKQMDWKKFAEMMELVP
jgi:hypothetical protein